jgi:hypothetical protein
LKSVLAKLADADLQWHMSAPPQHRRRNLVRKRRPLAERRRVDLVRKHRQLDREKAGLLRCTLWVSNRALEGIIRQFVLTGQLTDMEAQDHSSIERALTALIETQGAHWVR